MRLITFTKMLAKHFKIFFSLLCIFLLLLPTYELSAEEECLTPQEPNQRKFRYRSNPARVTNVQASYYLKIYVHVIRNTDGTGGFTRAEVDEILEYLDISFNPHQIYFVWDNEIDFIDDDYRAIFGPGFFYDDTNIFTVNNHFDGIDLYLYPGTTNASAGRANGVGESSEFWVSGTKEGRPSAKSFVTAHEMGHVLNLWHTHHGCETGNWEFTDGSNCDVAGDFVCDTPSDPLLTSFDVDPNTCIWNSFNICNPPENIDDYNPDTKNIMSYSAVDCREYFSQGQGERMREAIATLPYLQATVANVSTSACNIDDWIALKKLYEWTYGDNWINNTNWDILKQDSIPEDCSLRGLHGIAFDVTGRVTTINLYNNNLLGTLPDEIGDLAYLKYLDLGFNTLGDTINAQIGNLSQLEILYLDNNQFVGSIPSSFLNLDRLGQLRLHNNYLSGCFDVEFSQWCDRFSSNNFTVEGDNNNFESSFDSFCDTGNGICPIQNCNIDEWRALKQIYNSTNGSNWTDNLNWKMVNFNLPPIDCDLRKLGGVSLNPDGRVMGLDLYDNNLSGYLPFEIEYLTELTYLDLGHNELNDTLPSSLGNLNKLISLYLDNNSFSGNIPANIGNIESLEVLYLNNNSFIGCPDTNLTKLCAQLNETYNKNKYISEGNSLNIDWENFCVYGVDSCDVSPCEAEWYALKQLYLSTNGDNWNFSGGWDLVLENTPPLENCSLNLLHGIETDEDGFVIEIDLNNNNLTGSIPAEIGNFTRLEQIRLYNNALTGSIPPEFGSLTNLKLLYLFRTQVTGSIPPELGNLTNLTSLALSENLLSGSIPLELGNLENLVEMYLSFNELTGTIPPELGELQNLILLSLAENLLTGNIPSELGDMSSLNELYLSANNLSGCYNINLQNLCFQLVGFDIDFGNNLDATWFDFCQTGAGLCNEAASICHSSPELIIDGIQFEEATFHAAQNISSNAVIQAQTSYKAGSVIELNSGFEVDGSNNFQATIEYCE